MPVQDIELGIIQMRKHLKNNLPLLNDQERDLVDILNLTMDKLYESVRK